MGHMLLYPQKNVFLSLKISFVLESSVDPDEILYERRHWIPNNVVCATSKASDQPAHTRSLIRAFASCLNIL